MGVGLLRLFNAIEDQKLVQSYVNDGTYRLPAIFSGDRLNLEYTLVRRLLPPSIRTPFERVLAGSYNLKIGLFRASDGTQLAFQTTFTDVDSYTKAGILALDTAAINTALTGISELATFLEVETTDSVGNDQTFLRLDVTLKKSFIASGTVSEQPGQIGATQEWVRNLFLPKDGTNAATPSSEFYMRTTPSGFNVRLYLDDDGIWQRELF